MILYIITAVLYIGIIIILAQQRAPEEYSFKTNTISELACQCYENRSLMQWGFKGFGIIIILGIVINKSEMLKELYFTIPLFVYAIGILFTGFFFTKPFEHLVFYIEKQSKAHSFFFFFSGFGVSLLLFMKFMMVPGAFNKILNMVVLVFILFSSARTVKNPESRGIYQRILYFGTFVWLIYAYSGKM